jgi:hypothetical protein
MVEQNYKVFIVPQRLAIFSRVGRGDSRTSSGIIIAHPDILKASGRV